MRKDTSLVPTAFLVALPTTEYDTEARNLASIVHPTSDKLAPKLGERFYALERSRGKATKIHGNHALYTGGPRRR